MIVWTEYMRYRARLRGYDLAKIENIVRYSNERYLDSVTGRRIVVGRHDSTLVMIAYEESEGMMTPITVHAMTRQQIHSRLLTGRFTHA
jgi:hypothetical protein